jgi:hypothetical protein
MIFVTDASYLDQMSQNAMNGIGKICMSKIDKWTGLSSRPYILSILCLDVDILVMRIYTHN